MRFTMCENMFSDGTCPMEKFVFEANNQEEADSKAVKWLNYHGHSRKDGFATPSTGEQLNWTIHNEYIK